MGAVITEHRHADGSPVKAGHCVVPDNHIDVFIVELRSLDGATEDAVRRHLQTKWETLDVIHQRKVVTVR
jgi:hypothetical protein